MTLTKARLVERIQSVSGFTKKESHRLVDNLFETIKKGLVNGEDVLISGFGKFCVKDKNSRRWRNPATGEDLTIKPRKVVTFKCSGVLRNKINRHE